MLTFARKPNERKPEGSLKFLLHRHLSGPVAARPLSRVHASDLTRAEGMCPRYYALHDVLGRKPRDEWLTAADVVTYDMGNDQQEQIVGYFADMGKAVVHWQCLACGKAQEFCTRPAKCPHCGCRGFRSQDVRFVSDVTGASCGVDLLIRGISPKLTVVELKGAHKVDFTALVAPIAEHRLRTNLYLRIIAESSQSWAKMVNTTEAKVLYFCKGGYLRDPQLRQWGLTEDYSPFKEFDVKRDDKQTNAPSLRARVVKEYRDGTVGMPAGICPTALSQRAKYCSVRAECWSGNFPPQYDWSK